MRDLIVALVALLIHHPAQAGAAVACATAAGALAWIVVMLRAEPDDRLARVVAVVPAPPPPPAPGPPDRPLVNPLFAAHIAAQSARFAATHGRARRPGAHRRPCPDPPRPGPSSGAGPGGGHPSGRRATTRTTGPVDVDRHRTVEVQLW